MNKWTYYALWTIYIALLIVLLPHTAWAFAQFEPDSTFTFLGIHPLGWVAALAFEGAIAALTWRLKQRLETTPIYEGDRKDARRFAYQYVNVYGLGLLLAIAVSSLANWSHAVKFGNGFAVYDIPPEVYSVVFGAILPVCSLLFANILADTTGTEHQESQKVRELSGTIQEMKGQVREAERRARLAEQRFEAIGDLAILLTSDDKRERILAVHNQWAELPKRSVAMIAGASPGYVSDVLSENGKQD